MGEEGLKFVNVQEYYENYGGTIWVQAQGKAQGYKRLVGDIGRKVLSNGQETENFVNSVLKLVDGIPEVC